MGLDMNAYAVDENKTQKELQYWRKHAALHGWMTQLAIQKGVVNHPADFNCENVCLNLDDLNELETAINEWTLPETKGFFFGDFPPTRDTNEEDMQFVVKAREAIKGGNSVYYTAWW